MKRKCIVTVMCDSDSDSFTASFFFFLYFHEKGNLSFSCFYFEARASLSQWRQKFIEILLMTLTLIVLEDFLFVQHNFQCSLICNNTVVN